MGNSEPPNTNKMLGGLSLSKLPWYLCHSLGHEWHSDHSTTFSAAAGPLITPARLTRHWQTGSSEFRCRSGQSVAVHTRRGPEYNRQHLSHRWGGNFVFIDFQFLHFWQSSACRSLKIDQTWTRNNGKSWTSLARNIQGLAKSIPQENLHFPLVLWLCSCTVLTCTLKFLPKQMARPHISHSVIMHWSAC